LEEVDTLRVYQKVIKNKKNYKNKRLKNQPIQIKRKAAGEKELI
jgi:hypothetical protein